MNEPIGEHARKMERDAIVAWLRGEGEDIRTALAFTYVTETAFKMQGAAKAATDFAAAIERKQHLKKGGQ